MAKTLVEIRETLGVSAESASEDIRKAVFNKIPIETALKEWLDTQKNEETKRKYKRAVEKLFPSTQ